MLEHIQRYIIPAAFSLLPMKMRTPDAAVMLLAIGLQESRFEHRRQVGGPARGFWQFEQGGVRAVLEHYAVGVEARKVLDVLQYPLEATVADVYQALEHNDVLAAAFARLLLWASPLRLPANPAEADHGYQVYVSSWRPGKPKPRTWTGHYGWAWTAVNPNSILKA